MPPKPPKPPRPRPQIDAMKGRRFLVVGLPRSGTTYLASLLDGHRDIFCSGEQFNPHNVVHAEYVDENEKSVWDRDRMPLRFMDSFFAEADKTGVARAGFKFMIGHNVRVLRHLSDYPDLKIIYVWRDNKLAQVSSYLKALENQRWTQHYPDLGVLEKIDVTPRKISQHWHEMSTFDFLFRAWLDSQPQASLRVEYREMFQPGFNDKVCAFLGVETDPDMRSPLAKQNRNDILKRFRDPGPIKAYFEAIGCGHWLKPEL